MGKTILDIKILYDKMGVAERKIADFIMNDPQGVLPLSISQLAERCGGSEATIVRFSKKLGFDGYQQMKLALAKEANARPVSENITETDSAYDIFGKVCEDIYCSLEKTKKALDQKALEDCCNAILSAGEILVFGLGNSASVATDASHKMFRLGLKAHAYTDNHMQAIAAAHTNEQSIVIGISHSGASKDVLQAMEIAKQNGATTVSITGYKKSPIDKTSDISLHTVSDETNYRISGLSSRIAQLALIDAVYSYLVCKLQNSSERISKTESALQPKKSY
jgi:DNA-binding MurR/RpiR family transcriptional regulator